MTIWPDKQIVGPGGASVNRPDATPPTLIRKLLRAAGWKEPQTASPPLYPATARAMAGPEILCNAAGMPIHDDTSGDAPENDQTIRARQQADGLAHWARVLEAHEPDGSAAGIVMLREAAKTLRELATDAPPEPTEEMVDLFVWSDAVKAGLALPREKGKTAGYGDLETFVEKTEALRAALAVQQKGEQ